MKDPHNQWDSSYLETSIKVFTGSILFFFFLHFVIYPIITRKYVLLSPKHKDPVYQAEWSKRLNAVLFGFSVPFAIYYLTARYLWPYTIAYVTYDFLLAIYYRDGRILSFELVIHHVIMLLALTSQWISSFKHDFACLALLTEISTPFLNMRWILHELGLANTHWYPRNGLVLWLTFLLFRVIPTPYMYYHLFMDVDKDFEKSHPFVWWWWFIFVSFMGVMNFYWFWLISVKVFRYFFGKSKKE